MKAKELLKVVSDAITLVIIYLLIIVVALYRIENNILYEEIRSMSADLSDITSAFFLKDSQNPLIKFIK